MSMVKLICCRPCVFQALKLLAPDCLAALNSHFEGLSGFKDLASTVSKVGSSKISM